MTIITIPNEYGYVLLTATGLLGLAQWHGIWVGGYRKAAKIPYPNAYATAEQASRDQAAYSFNCAQRAHQNFLENFTMALAGLLISGVRYPLLASAFGAIWGAGRVVYALGYAKSPLNGNGKGRYKGSFFYIGHFGLIVLTGMTAYSVLLA